MSLEIAEELEQLFHVFRNRKREWFVLSLTRRLRAKP
jgi:hypothetical protein